MSPPTPYHERVLSISCQGCALTGVVADAEQPAKVAVVVIVGGPQYRVGSHRQFVQLCRGLAANGTPSLRFDVRGMGDSGGEPRTFEELDDDICAALDTMQVDSPGIRRFVLWGLCDGASAAMMYLARRRDPRIAGMVLVNPWVRSSQTKAKARLRFYYWQRISTRAFWHKLLRGAVRWRAIVEWWSNLREGWWRADWMGVEAAGADFRSTMALGLSVPGVSSLVILSGADLTAQEFKLEWQDNPTWVELRNGRNVRIVELPGAGHTLAEPSAAQDCLNHTRRLVQEVEEFTSRSGSTGRH